MEMEILALVHSLVLDHIDYDSDDFFCWIILPVSLLGIQLKLLSFE